MPAFPIRERLIPYRILTYLLYADEAEHSWLERINDGEIRVTTGEAARSLRLKNANLWQALYWLETNKLVVSVKKEQKRGTAIVCLLPPTNLTGID